MNPEKQPSAVPGGSQSETPLTKDKLIFLALFTKLPKEEQDKILKILRGGEEAKEIVRAEFPDLAKKYLEDSEPTQ